MMLSVAFLGCAMAVPALADSQARIVRLSDVHGAVEIDKNAGNGYERAFVNLPLTQGAILRTQDEGRAEVEFEDGSTLRLTPHTTVEFKSLSLSDGKHISELNLTDGKAYVNWLGKSGDALTLNFSRDKMTLLHVAHFRVETAPALAEVAVFKGEVEVVGPSGTLALGKKKMATFDPAADDKATLAKDFEQDAYDGWDKHATEYHDTYSRNNATPYGYGYSDLSYYGSFSNVAGYGTLWQPYFTGVGWDPFMDGAWASYPGYGSLWVSAYPWGWTPYMYGNWVFVPGAGWMWQPGGWSNWNGTPRFIGTPPQRFTAPTAPATPGSTVVVGNGGPVLKGTPPLRGTTVIARGSAGLNVPRGSLGNLAHLNREVTKTGSVALASAPHAYSAVSPPSGFEHSAATASSGMHSGSAPASHSSGGGRPH
jgi:hypothetical protein